MRIGIIIVFLAGLLFAAPAFAQVATPINSQGVSGAPISVSTLKAVLLGNPSRVHWAIFSETVAIRCTLGTSAGTGTGSSGAGSPVPTASVGFYLNTGIVYNETAFQMGSGTATRELDCISTGAATSVDTWEE
jgi:hypothetical protein